MRNGSQLRAQVRFRIPPDTDAHLSDIAGPALTPTRTFARFDRKGRRDIPQSRLFDHLVGAGEQRGRHGEVERLGGFEVDRQVERCGLLHRQVGWLHPSEDFVHVDRGASVQFRRIGAIGQKSPDLDQPFRRADQNNLAVGLSAVGSSTTSARILMKALVARQMRILLSDTDIQELTPNS